MASHSRLAVDLAFLLLVAAAMLSPARFRWAAAGGAAAVLAGAAWWAGERVAAAGGSVVLLFCLATVLRTRWADGGIAFNADEQDMVEMLFAGLARNRARHLIDQGVWLTGKPGDTLTREGEPVDHLYYLAAGEARVLSGGVEVGRCRRGDLVGELTVLSGEQASATVILATPARFWCAPADDLRPYVEAHEDIRRAIEHGFATVLKAKLRASNRTIAQAAGSRSPGAE